MRNLLVVVIIIAAFLSSCCDCDDLKNNETKDNNATAVTKVANDLVPTQILVNQKFNFDPLTGDEKYLGGLDHNKFINDIIDKALNKQLLVYSLDGINTEVSEPMDEASINAYLGAPTDTIMVEDEKTGELIKKVVRQDIDKKSIKNLFFSEAWYYNDNQFIMTKEVEGYGVVQNFYRESDVNKEKPLQRVSFYLDFDNKNQKILADEVKDPELIAENIRYECDPNENEAWSKNFDKNHFTTLIINKILNGDVKAYDFYDSTAYSIDKVKELIQYYDGSFYADAIEGYIFIEDWYLDETTYKIIKKVKGIAPILVFYRPDDENMTDPQKQILFTVWFNQKK